MSEAALLGAASVSWAAFLLGLARAGLREAWPDAARWGGGVYVALWLREVVRARSYAVRTVPLCGLVPFGAGVFLESLHPGVPDRWFGPATALMTSGWLLMTFRAADQMQTGGRTRFLLATAEMGWLSGCLLFSGDVSGGLRDVQDLMPKQAWMWTARDGWRAVPGREDGMTAVSANAAGRIVVLNGRSLLWADGARLTLPFDVKPLLAVSGDESVLVFARAGQDVTRMLRVDRHGAVDALADVGMDVRAVGAGPDRFLVLGGQAGLLGVVTAWHDGRQVASPTVLDWIPARVGWDGQGAWAVGPGNEMLGAVGAQVATPATEVTIDGTNQVDGVTGAAAMLARQRLGWVVFADMANQALLSVAGVCPLLAWAFLRKRRATC